ncbi:MULTISPECIES: TetR/AcrR family transcriptional regulator [Streptomyces]|uniref:TetR/AcrR family transcriptional regulator n=1 Tax=Streptomyces TaxID=1883 RepID=UPI00224D6536|nr:MULTISPECIES: TetR/AcrR family transcriptional regulator [Streptomyces]MCX5059156.1 TetR/AcrR family transcriptional regulator [Streptomyces sp. NBC_00452]WSD90547.1 TetR/AcrR family transcriptional regulator [Streptomyces canus]
MERRPSYGPNSITIGDRGATTVGNVLQTALALFGEKGFHNTTIQDIADQAGMSRATLYQYFESKERIFIELLEECGASLLDLARHLEPLSATERGFSNLRWWLDRWAEVYERYEILFREWSNIDTPGAPVRPLVAKFNETYNTRIADWLSSSGVNGVDPRDAANMLTSLIIYLNYADHASKESGSGTRLPSEELRYYFSVSLQLMLFPETPVDVTRGDRTVPRAWKNHRITGKLASRDLGPMPTPYSDRVAGLTARAVQTVNILMRAGGECFAEFGYQKTNIDDIVRTAGFARGTFYKYFDTKVELLEALAEMCARDLIAGALRLERVNENDYTNDFKEWVRTTLKASSEYRGVIRAWRERRPATTAMEGMRAHVATSIRRALFLALSRSRRGHPMHLSASRIFVGGVFDQFPDTLVLHYTDPSPEYLETLIADLLDRAILGFTDEARHSPGPRE